MSADVSAKIYIRLRSSPNELNAKDYQSEQRREGSEARAVDDPRVDTGPLYAAVDADDQDHERCLAVLQSPGIRLFLPALVVAEATYLVGMRLGPRVEAAFLSSLAQMEVEAPAAGDWARIAQLVERYADFPLGGTDASVVVLAERLGTDTIITLDRRHLGAVRPTHCRSWRLLPE